MDESPTRVPAGSLPVRGYDDKNRTIEHPSAAELASRVRAIGQEGSQFIVLLRIPHMPHDSLQAGLGDAPGTLLVSFRTGDDPWQEATVPAEAAPGLFLAWAANEPGWQGDHAWERAGWWNPADPPEPDPEAAAWASGQAQRFIDEGYLEFDELVDALHELSDSDPRLSSAQAQAIAAPLWRERVAAQAAWGASDCDRLTAAFADLDGRGIVARENFACCQNCGTTEIWGEADDATRGYAFFHMQDTEYAPQGAVHLSYGSRSDATEDVESIGEEIVKVLGEHGLRTEWNGSRKTRIEVLVPDWRRRLK
ncbi:hypothetical protein [Glycomyces sp. NRRL B-16210]|uniref:DUF6891 domain-containing protein n=1 Tax=Glycomyces sp. NRRL B-16210 TaxID=1463821 RepID=UPI000556816C|nr:hypothetical protein [Glycomyces sp. NRRL B-16210]